MKLSNSSRWVLNGVQGCFTAGVPDPTIGEIAEAMIGTTPAPGSPIHDMVKRALPSVDLYLRDELNLRVVPVNGAYYGDPDLGGLGRKAPKNMLAARSVLAVAGRPIAGIVQILGKNGNGNGKYLWDAHLLFWHKVQLVTRENYGLKLQSYVDRQWLQAGRLDSLSIQDIQQQLLTA